MSNNGMIIKRICFTAVFSAITVILYLFAKFKLPIFPDFLEVNLSMIPVIIAAFMLGPIDAAVCVILRCLLKWLFQGTNTGYVGELADVLIGLAACIPAGIIYNHTKLKHKTIIALASVIVCWVTMGLLSNAIINIPWYSSFYFKVNYYKDGVPFPLIGMTADAVHTISFGQVAASSINKDNYMFYYQVFAVLPFNLMLSTVIVVITALVHTRLKALYNLIGNTNKNDNISFEETKTEANVEETKIEEEVQETKTDVEAVETKSEVNE